jgi:alkanesulfonate monooxygenase SsuD/methylene tetrahydromethanopterin reductase-like flavin-dependent oxidoreductase (luciferase family)
MSTDRRFKVGVTIHPQQCTIQQLRDAWRRADELGVDSIWFWDHFFPLYGDPDGKHFECWCCSRRWRWTRDLQTDRWSRAGKTRP